MDTSRAIKAPKYTEEGYQEKIVDIILNTTFIQEYNRIRLLKENPDAPNIENFNKNGLKFNMLSCFNGHINVDGYLTPKKIEEAREVLTSYFSQQAESEITHFFKGISEVSAEEVEKYRQYFYNNYLAQLNIRQLLAIDDAFFKNGEDFAKRNKESAAPKMAFYTDAVWVDSDGNYHTVGKETENFLIVEDIKKDGINLTDGQSYRSLDSAKALIGMTTG